MFLNLAFVHDLLAAGIAIDARAPGCETICAMDAARRTSAMVNICKIGHDQICLHLREFKAGAMRIAHPRWV